MKLVFFMVLFMILIFSATAIAQGPLCTEGDRRMCGSDIGICEPGRSICKGGQWVECIGSVGPISARAGEIDVARVRAIARRMVRIGWPPRTRASGPSQHTRNDPLTARVLLDAAFRGWAMSRDGATG